LLVPTPTSETGTKRMHVRGKNISKHFTRSQKNQQPAEKIYRKQQSTRN
jgi:hypothetical protein